MRLAIILTSGCLLIQIFYHGAVLGESTTAETPKGFSTISGALCSIIVIPFGKRGLDDASNNETNTMWNSTYNDNLKRDLFVNYNKFARPLENGKMSNVKIGLTVRHVDIDELKGKITVYGWMKMHWQDDKFKWSSSDYGNVLTMHVAADDVWRPDIALFNSATDRDDHLGGSQIIISNTGSILWVPPVVFTAFCSLNIQLWPFDTQNCHLKIGSWSLNDIKLSLFGGPSTASEVDAIVENSEWEVQKVSTDFGEDQFYHFVRIEFKLARRAAMYKALIFTPASCIILMVLSSFWLPPQMGEKLLLNGIVIVVIAAFLMYFAQLLPVLAQNTPLVVLFYSSSLLLVSVSTIISVIVLYISSAKHRRRMPLCLRNFLNGPISYLLCLSLLSSDTDPQSPVQKELTDQSTEGHAEDPQNMYAPTIRSIQFDWIVLATAIDRIFFFFYCIIFIVLAIVYSV